MLVFSLLLSVSVLSILVRGAGQNHYAPTANRGSVLLIANDETMNRTTPSAGLIAVCSTCPSQSLTKPRFWPAFTRSFTATAGYQKPSCSLRNQRNRSSSVNG